MIKEHPSEALLQEFVLNPDQVEKEIVNHIEDCVHCKQLVSQYQLIDSALKTQEKPVFEFDVTQLVLPQIGQRKEGYYWYRWLIIFIAVVITGLLTGVWYFFGQSLAGVLKGFGSLFIYLLATAALIILLLQGLDMYKAYQKKINSLNFY